MSRIGYKPIIIPTSVTLTQESGRIIGKSAKGELSVNIPSEIKVTLNEGKLTLDRRNNQIQTKAYHGLVRSLIQNVVIGLTDGYVKKLELVGTGYRAKVQGQGLTLSLGFSHSIDFPAPQGITFTTESDTVVVISGIDKQLVGEVAAKIRALRPPEPYKGKGVRYQGEVIRRKAGKAAKTGSAS